jgi:hypothetical protein
MEATSVKNRNARRWLASWILAAGLGISASAQAAGPDPARWEGYLDYAYVYSSADPAALRARIADYGRDAGLTLEEYLAELPRAMGEGEASTRRQAIGYLLLYLAERNVALLEQSVDRIAIFEGQQGRHENAYWYHYILAHRALEKANPRDFVRHNLELWLNVVVPLESSYRTLEALSLSQSANSGFASALPYVFENLSRLILIRSQELGMHRKLDPLVGIVRMLHDGRIGAHPDVIPLEASSRDYLERIVDRVTGPESDGGSLTFTLALLEATRYHEQARALLASEGLSRETIRSIGVASGAYEAALDSAETLQGRAAVYIRVLRQLGEIYAAKQRLGVDPYVEIPFQIEGAIDTYSALFDSRQGDEWMRAGFRSNGRDAYVSTLHALWEEIQETHLNAADYYLARSLNEPSQADPLARSAARMYSRYFSFFQQFATPDSVELVPDSAYFAAYECARGFGDALMSYSRSSPTASEIDLVVQRYVVALRLYPFDRRLWPALSTALESKGQSSSYMDLARPIADSVVRSRHVDKWIQKPGPTTELIAAMRKALADDLVLMYLGFADSDNEGELEQGLADLRAKRDALKSELAELRQQQHRSAPYSGKPDTAAPGPAARAPSSSGSERAAATRRIHEAAHRLAKLERLLEARTRAVPLYRDIRDADRLIDGLRAQRDHPMHTLLRRMTHESRRQQEPGSGDDR